MFIREGTPNGFNTMSTGVPSAKNYEYDLGACMFCQLCVNACPHDAITFDQNFEHAVFDRTKLVLKLNHDGSKVIEKKKEV